MALYALLLGPPSGLALFVVGWFFGATSYADDIHDVAAPGSSVLALAALFAACGMFAGGAIGLVIGARRSRDLRPHERHATEGLHHESPRVSARGMNS
ncbi:hypothetical protein ASG12_06705 [Williamsia sp. Leaf354]|nr:hypothetical protein ASG12_06705 [Williamsia sp. Leaf354]